MPKGLTPAQRRFLRRYRKPEPPPDGFVYMTQHRRTVLVPITEVEEWYKSVMEEFDKLSEQRRKEVRKRNFL